MTIELTKSRLYLLLHIPRAGTSCPASQQCKRVHGGRQQLTCSGNMVPQCTWSNLCSKCSYFVFPGPIVQCCVIHSDAQAPQNIPLFRFYSLLLRYLFACSLKRRTINHPQTNLHSFNGKERGGGKQWYGGKMQ